MQSQIYDPGHVHICGYQYPQTNLRSRRRTTDRVDSMQVRLDDNRLPGRGP
jgi:hypothetical protein